MSRPTTMVPVKQQRGGDRMLGQFGQDLLHRLVQVDLDAMFMLAAVLVGDQAARIAVHLLDEQAVPGDLGLDVAVGRAGNRHADRAGGAVARQADDPHVVGKVLAAELGADAELLGGFQQPVLQLHVAEGLAVLVALGRQAVQFLGGSQLDGLHAGVGRGAADDKGDVVGRAGGGTQVFHLFNQELFRACPGSAGPWSPDRAWSCWRNRPPWR